MSNKYNVALKIMAVTVVAISMTIGITVLAVNGVGEAAAPGDCYATIKTNSTVNTCDGTPCKYYTFTPSLQVCWGSTIRTGFNCNTSTNPIVNFGSVFTNGTCDIKAGTCSMGDYAGSVNETNYLPTLISCDE